MSWRMNVRAGVATCVLAAAAVAADPESTSSRDSIGPQDVAALRARGPEGLDQALRAYDERLSESIQLQKEVDRLCVDGFDKNKAAVLKVQQQLSDVEHQLDTYRAAIDQIGGQRTCAVSRLYWYTDLDAAKAEAKRTGRPILSLRMLGKLTDEFSCANSRFFRTALYSNAKVSQFLRDNYVLHWQSVRPVPRVTIDFGDGRKLERTLTGNSVHYVLASDGTPLDVLPGLYSPHEFRRWLARLEEFNRRYAAAAEKDRPAQLADFHRERRRLVYHEWADDIRKLGETSAAMVQSRIDGAIESAWRTGSHSPLAVAASKLAATKTQAETPLLRLANFNGPWIEQGMDDELWRAIADLHRDDVKLDEASVAVMRQEFPRAGVAALRAESKRRQEDPILRVVRAFENSISVDTVRNEYLLHRRIHEAFADNQSDTANVDRLNEWVYSTLFLTPSSDPWLGLAPPDVYTALENDGRLEAKSEVAARDGG